MVDYIYGELLGPWIMLCPKGFFLYLGLVLLIRPVVAAGSFNAQHEIVTDKNPHAKELFEAEQQDLLNDLHEIPQRSCDRKVCYNPCIVILHN